MKRPEETKYPIPKNLLEESKKIIEMGIDKEKFSFPYDKITRSPELELWLKEYGWSLHRNDGDFRENEPSIWEIKPI